jgi:RNA polymerase sigma factor for flagellar operon FliA
MTRQELEALFLSNLPTTEKILGALGRRHRLSPDAVDEFSAWAKLRLVENDYAILGKFRGESSLATYLTVVIAMLYREYRVQEWGRWRPSAAAKRHGSLGVRLETLVNRDGMSIAEAGRLLHTSGETNLSDRELAAIVSEFPRRTPLRPIETADPPEDVEARDRADHRVDAEEADAASVEAKRALVDALNTLPREDRLIVQLHYMESMSVADIARGLALPQKPLYRRLDRLIAKLRISLERAGISRERVRELAGGQP